MDDWCRRQTDEGLLEAVKHDRWFVRALRGHASRKLRENVRHIKAECRRRGLCTKSARPEKTHAG